MNNFNKFLIPLCFAFVFVSCKDDDCDDHTTTSTITTPNSYAFSRNGSSSVSYSGQTTRIAMAEELIDSLLSTSTTETQLDAMFAHVQDVANFSDATLNSSDKSVYSKLAASTDYFSSNTTDQSAIRTDFEGWIANQVSQVFPNWSTTATSGNPGQLQEAGGGSIRYINAQGLEYNQAFAKGLIGGLMVDQMLNNYLSTSVLDAGTNQADNNAQTLVDGTSYTTMEHKWDEAFGYLYGGAAAASTEASACPIGHGSFLNKYVDRVNSDTDFSTIADDICNAFKLGRQAIVEQNYTVRDQQAEIIREKISQIIGIRAVYYLQQGKANLSSDQAGAFHDLSEGYGFIYSLQFTRKPGTTTPYLTKAEVDAHLATLMTGNGFWDVTATTLDNISTDIVSKFSSSFTLEQAAN